MAAKRDDVGRPATRGGERGHIIHVEAYDKFVPDDYDVRKKRKR